MKKAAKRARVRIDHYKNLARTPALPLAVEAWDAVLKSGHGENVVMVMWDDQALVATVDGKPAAVLTYKHTEWSRQYNVALGYTRPAHRRRGLYAKLYQALRKRAQDDGVACIESSTALKNAPMRAHARACGRAERGVLLIDRLDP